MQQQEILFRKATFKLLSRADTLRQSWHTHQSAVLSIVSTMVNLRQQQTSMVANVDTTTVHQLEETYTVNTQRLLYKQTQRYEKAMIQLRTRLEQWHSVIQDWHQLAIDAQHNAAKAQAARLTNNTGSSNDDDSNAQQAAPLSSHSLLQVTSVSPAQALEWILQLEDLYKRQYHCNRMLFLQLFNNNTSGALDLAAIMDQLSSNKHLQQQCQTITQDISGRLQLYNHIKKVIEST